MKVIGLIGGMSWESSQIYYQLINEEVKKRLGGLHSAELIMYSIDFAPMEALQREHKWQEAADWLTSIALKLQHAGAGLLLIGTNTMHIVAEQVANNIRIPLVHIADAVGERLVAQKLTKVALFGTAFTMTEAFYRVRLQENFGLEVITPDVADRKIVHDVIYNELCKGEVLPSSKQRYLEIAGKLQAAGAQGVILGCTEIGMLIQQEDCAMPLFDTVEIHAAKAVDLAFQ